MVSGGEPFRKNNYMSNTSTRTPKRQLATGNSSVITAVKPHERALADTILSLDEGKLPSDVFEVGNYTGERDELIRAFHESREIYERVRQTLVRSNPRLAFAISTATPAKSEPDEQEDKRFTTGKDGRRVIKLWSIEDIYGLPDAEALISGMLETASVSLLYGMSGTGKTFISLDLALSIAHGIPWMGRIVKQGYVIYVNTEGGRGLKKRLKAWYIEHEGLDPSPNFNVIPWSLSLKDNMSDLIETIESLDEPPVLIVLDNFSMCAPGVNQNLQEEVTALFNPLHALASEYSSHIMVIHHTNKEGDVNGTMAFRNHVDFMNELKKDDRADKNSPITLRSEKTRDDEGFKDIKVELKQVPLYVDEKSMREVSSCVVVLSAAPAKTPELPDNLQNMLDILGDEPKISATWERETIERLGIATATFNRYKTKLKDGGYIKKTAIPGERFDGYIRVKQDTNDSQESGAENA